MFAVDYAVRLALQAHMTEVDKAGAPMILHALRVGMAGETEAEQIVGFLHDTIEDGRGLVTEYTLRHTFKSEIADAVMVLTRREGEPYLEYIKRVAQNPLARRVKLNDLRDHIAPARIDAIPMSMALRYGTAIERLERGE